MRGIVGMLCVAAVGNLGAAVVNALDGDVLGTVLPAVLAVATAFFAYRYVKNPPKPQPWTRTRVVLSVVFGGSMTLAVLGMLGWTAIAVPDWPIRVVAVGSMVFVVCVVIWAVRTARRLHQQAVESEA